MSDQDQILNKCGCCEEIKCLTPVSTKNLPGLDAIAYRVGTHGSFLKTMLSGLSKEPGLHYLTTRDTDDFAIALLDAWAMLGDVLAFYQERIANEAYLRSASERRSVLELARHISYKLRPGVAAGTFLAFQMEEAQGAPSQSIIPSGTKAQSIPGQNQLPQIFETTEEILAEKRLNVLKPQTAENKTPGYVDKEIYLRGTLNGLKPGDTLLMIGVERIANKESERWDFRRITDVLIDHDLDRTRVTWEGGLGWHIFNRKVLPAEKDFQVFAFQQRAFLFGYNAPDWRIIPDVIKNEFPVPGLIGKYYDGIGFNSEVLKRIDSKIYFKWGLESPHEFIKNDCYSVRWTGFIKADISGDYKFITNSDDGVRLWIDDNLIINKWIDQAATKHTGTRWMDAGRSYGFKLEYYENGGEALIQLFWSGPDINGEQIVPETCFYHPNSSTDWPDFTIGAIAGFHPGEEITRIHLDNLYPKIIEGSWLVMVTAEPCPYFEVFEVLTAEESSRKNFTLASKTTAITLKGENILKMFNTSVRETVVYAQSEELITTEAPVTTPVEGCKIVLDKMIPDLPEKRTIIISGKRIRVQLSDKARPILIKSSDSSERRTISNGDSYIVLKTPEDIGNRLIWELKDKNGFIGTVKASLNQLRITPAYDDDEIVSEINCIEETLSDSDPTTIILKKTLVNSFDRKTVSIYANVAKATHGETKIEILGSGNGSEVFQRFELKQKPLTYISASTANGISSTLSIRVNDILWKEVPTLYGYSPDDHVYTVHIADDQKVTIEFGDGITGARLPTGVENIKASFRIGTGFEGLTEAGQISQLMSRPLGVKGVTNPLPPSGADNPEALDKARRNAPFTVLAMDRIVSLQDFEDFTRAFVGIGKARADILWKGEERLVFITIAAADGSTISESSEMFKNLVRAINSARHSNYQVKIGSYRPVTFTLAAGVLINKTYVEEDVLRKVSDALKNAYSFEKHDFGQTVTPSDVISVIQKVPGVIAVDLDAINGISPYSREHFSLRPETAKWSGQIILPAELLTININGIKIRKMI